MCHCIEMQGIQGSDDYVQDPGAGGKKVQGVQGKKDQGLSTHLSY